MRRRLGRAARRARTWPARASSNVLTKVLEWGRLMAYLEQSTRYVPSPNVRTAGGNITCRRRVAARRSPQHSLRTMDAAFEHLRALDPGRWKRTSARSIRRRPEDSDAVYRVGDPRQGARHASRSAAGGDDLESSGCSAPDRRSKRCCSGCSRIRSRKCTRCARADADRAPPDHSCLSRAGRSAG